MRVVIIGGVAAGPKIASKVARLMPDAEVTIIEKGEFLSYAGCGLPYYVSGVVKEQAELMCTPVGTVRDAVFFRDVKNVHVLNHTEAVEIDREGKRVKIVGPEGEGFVEYDKLALATGAQPVIPPIPGTDLRNVFTLHGVQDAEGIKALLAERKALDVVVVGGGLIGVEMTEALAHHGCRVTIVEMLPQILPMLDADMARLVRSHMESSGARVLTGTKVEALEGGEGTVGAVKTSAGTIPAQMVVLAVGVRPNVTLARNAGLQIGPKGGIKVNEKMQTSDPDIYAAGDCVESRNLITGEPDYVPLGSTANKQGRVAACAICGRDDSFPGIVGTTICKVFDYAVAKTGLTERAAREAGYDIEFCYAPGPDRAHYMPTAQMLYVKLVADRKTRRLLGAQIVGPGAADKRVDIAAAAITAGMTVDQIANLDLAYAPPYASAMDNLITAANVMRNKLDGLMSGIRPDEVLAMVERGDGVVLLDVRTDEEYEQARIEGSVLIPLGSLRKRMHELPQDKTVIAFCKLSLRGYEAAIVLRQNGFRDVKVMDGGIMMWPGRLVGKDV